MCVFFILVHFVDLFQSTQKLQNFEQRKTIKTMNKNNKLFDTSHYDYVNSALTFHLIVFEGCYPFFPPFKMDLGGGGDW